MHAALVINPAAGRGAGRRLAAAIADYLAELGVHIQSQDISRSGSDLAIRVQERLAAHPDAVIVVGGDGSVHAAVNGWVKKRMGSVQSDPMISEKHPLRNGYRCLFSHHLQKFINSS